MNIANHKLALICMTLMTQSDVDYSEYGCASHIHFIENSPRKGICNFLSSYPT